jgi:hypothetical protein
LLLLSVDCQRDFFCLLEVVYEFGYAPMQITPNVFELAFVVAELVDLTKLEVL